MHQIATEVSLPLLCSIIVLCVSFVIGNFLTSRLEFIKRLDFFFAFGLSTTLGLGILSNFSLLMGIMGPLNKLVVWLLCILIIIIGYRRILNLFKELISFLS